MGHATLIRPSPPWVAWLAAAAVVAAGGLAAGTSPAGGQPMDLSGRWEAVPAAGVKLDLSVLPAPGDAAAQPVPGPAIRLAIDFQGHGGYAIARRRLDLRLPENYRFIFWVRGDIPRENLEWKLVDPSGDNVWWTVRRDFAFPREWQRVVVKQRHLGFAWGPAGGGEIHHAGALEIAVSAGRGGRGVVDLAGFTFEPLPPPHPYAGRPVVTASSSAPGSEPAWVLLGGPRAAGRHGGWHSATLRGAAAPEQWLVIDFQERRELGGLVIDWGREDFATRFVADTSDDGVAWQASRTVERGGAGRSDAGGSSAGGRSFLYLPETDARYVRLRLLASSRGRGYGIRRIGVLPVELSSSPNAFFAAVARASPRGSYPRAIGGEQSLWTLAGVDGGSDQGLLDEDGRLEAGAGGFSIEPFVLAGGGLIGWSDVRATPSLAAGALPIPSVRWRRAGLALEVTAFGAGAADSPVLYARYRLRNLGQLARRARLFLALRPFQVDPPSQWLGKPGGVVEVRRIAFDGKVVRLAVGEDGTPRILWPLAPVPAAFGAMTFDQGPIVALLRRGQVPAAAAVEDPSGYATAALAYDLRLEPGAAGEVDVAIPLAARAAAAEPAVEPRLTVEPGPEAPARVRQLQRQVAAAWEARLGGFAVRLPPAAGPLAATLRTAVAHILISRDGPALRPGTRSYARSWIRDGALMSEALLRLGMAREVRDFAAWYAGFQQADGKVPCCVDGRGADPVPENDSHGELLYLLASYYRWTGDRSFLESMWEHVAGAVAAIDALRQERRTPAWRLPATVACFGLLPESISHEGYSAKPVHSYWDDFFALRGVADAAGLARSLGEDELARRWEAMRDELRADLLASLGRTIAGRGLDYIPGSVELADFDPTSTAIAVSPGGELADLPAAALRHTFERYYREVLRRRRGGDWISYTPYELRNVGVFVRLGWRERARRLLAAMVADRRPPSWNQWPEVVWKDPRRPGFLGDLPHAWIAAEYIRAVLDLLAYERDGDHALVIAAGIPAAWVRHGGVAVRGMRTAYGSLDYTLAADRSGVRLRLGGDLRVPPGGLAVHWPFAGEATVNGRPLARRDQGAGGGADGGELIVRELPALVRLSRRHSNRSEAGRIRSE